MKFLSSVLRGLDRTYRFDGALPPSNEVELSSAVQLVHDTAREAQYATFGAQSPQNIGVTHDSWRRFGISFSHAGAGNMTGSVNPYTVLALDATRFLLWFHRCGGMTDVTTAATSGAVALQRAASAGLGGSIMTAVFTWTGATIISGTSGILTPIYDKIPWVPIFSGDVFLARSVASAAQTVDLDFMVLVLPRGIPPMFT